MKTNLLEKTVMYFLVLGVVLFSCRGKEQGTDVFGGTEIDTIAWNKIDSANLATTIPNFDISLSRGATWKAWMKMHKACMEAQWFKHPYYMGVTNTINLGAIINSTNGLQRRLEDALSPQEVKEVTNLGAFSNCGFTQDFSLNISALLQAEFNIADSIEDALTAELTVKVQSSKKTSMKIEKWRINNIAEGVLMDKLAGNDPKKVSYLTDLKKNGFGMIYKVAEIEGFKTTLEFETDISPELQAKLKNGVLAKFGNGNIQAQLTLVNKRTIEMTSTSNVYVFVEPKKGTKVST